MTYIGQTRTVPYHSPPAQTTSGPKQGAGPYEQNDPSVAHAVPRSGGFVGQPCAGEAQAHRLPTCLAHGAP
jgi:hypothetical protein